MITEHETGEVTIQAGNVILKLNPNPPTQDELDRIAAYNPDNADEVIEQERKMRSIHKRIIDFNQLGLIEEMIGQNPNQWFITYCQQKGIEL